MKIKDEKSIVETMFEDVIPAIEFIDVTLDEKESDDKICLGYQGTKL